MCNMQNELGGRGDSGDKQNGGENAVNAVCSVENKDAESIETDCRVVNEEWGERGKRGNYGQ